MQYEDFMKMLKGQIALMPHTRQLNFALKICKELFFDYQRFYEVYNWGNPDLLLDAITFCEEIVKDSSNIGQANDYLLQIESIIPDTDDFVSTLGSCALNASSAVSEILWFLIDNNAGHIYDIATYYTDTVYLKIDDIGVLTTEAIDNHPSIIKARSFILAETI